MEASKGANEKPKGFEYRHIKCGETMVNAVVQEHGLFYWELVGTQTIVSKESHLEPGGFLDAVFGDENVVYSVWTEERFATVDLKRDKGIPDLEQIKSVEDKYFHIVWRLQQIGCSLLDNYAIPPSKKGIGCGAILFPSLDKSWAEALKKGDLRVLFFPWLAPLQAANREYEENLALHRRLKAELAQLVDSNKQILNV